VFLRGSLDLPHGIEVEHCIEEFPFRLRRFPLSQVVSMGRRNTQLEPNLHYRMNALDGVTSTV